MKSIKKLTALVLAFTLVLGMGVTAQAAEGDKPILALGADLSADQRATVLGLLGISESDLGDYDVISITSIWILIPPPASSAPTPCHLC